MWKSLAWNSALKRLFFGSDVGWSTSWSSCRAASLSEIPCDSYHGNQESLGLFAFDSPAWPALSIYLDLCLPDGLSLHLSGPSPLKRRVLPSRTTQRADNRLLFHFDTKIVTMAMLTVFLEMYVRDSAHTRPAGGLCDSLCKQNPLETFVDGNDKSRRFTGPPAPSERPHGGSSITQQERHKEDQGMKAGDGWNVGNVGTRDQREFRMGQQLVFFSVTVRKRRMPFSDWERGSWRPRGGSRPV